MWYIMSIRTFNEFNEHIKGCFRIYIHALNPIVLPYWSELVIDDQCTQYHHEEKVDSSADDSLQSVDDDL